MKIILSSLVFLFTINLVVAQSDKLIEKANQKVDDLNQMIISEDPDLALTVEQRAQVQKLHIQKLVDIKKINKSKATDEEKQKQRKAIYKSMSKKIHQDVLTKEQKRAKMEAKKKQKEK